MDDEESDSSCTNFYQKHRSLLKMKYVEMICHLAEQNVVEPVIPVGFEIAPLDSAAMSALYDCYYQAFSAGDAGFFFDQGEEERRDFFETLGYPEAIREQASIILRREERLVGFLYSLPYGDNNLHISCMCVLPEFQGRGLGFLLLREVMKRAYSAGYETITLGTETDMKAFNLYRKNGFKIT